jgi:hypothetical protein
MEREVSWVARRDELAAKLAQRSASCPGLYPFREAADFLRVAQDQAGDEAESVCQLLEAMWQRPERLEKDRGRRASKASGAKIAIRLSFTFTRAGKPEAVDRHSRELDP